MLSVILAEGDKTDRLEELCRNQLRSEEFEIVRAEDWHQGLKQAKGEFVCLLEPSFGLSDDYFHYLLDVFLDQPSFRKMGMVASAVSSPFWPDYKRVYGYLVTPTHIIPSNIKSSSAPYTIQIGYIPGAIVRKAVLKLPEGFGTNVVLDSAQLSIDFWENGLRCLINPRTVYYSRVEKLDFPVPKPKLPKDMDDLLKMFKRELIG